MIVTLEKTKLWLKVESTDEDALITDLISTAEGIVEGVLRFSLAEYGVAVPEEVKTGIYYAVSKMYEERNELDVNQLIEVLKGLLFSYRREGW